MIQVLLLILKIIGITLLVLLGLLLLTLVLVLFVPVFYKARVVHNPEKTQVKAKVSFLFPFLLVTVQYLKNISYKVRIFGIPLLDSERPKKEKKPKKPKKAKKKKEKKSRKQKKEEILPENGQADGAAVPLMEPDAPEQVVPELETDSAVSVPETAETQNKEPEPSGQPEEKQSLFEKIKGKIQKIRETISNIIKKIKKLLHQKDEALRILGKPETKRAFAFAWDKLKHLLKHVLPRKIKGYVAYGADNPAATGQALGVLSVLYAKTGQLLEIRPNFEEKQLECDVEIKGRIQVFTLLVIAVKVVLNKEIRQLIKEVKGIREIE